MNGKQLKNSILQWAIQGKLVPQDPNDEPASVLLEKIRAAKERLVKEKKIKKDKNESFIFRGEDNSYYEKFLATGEVKCIDEEIPFEIPKGWEWCRLGNIIDFSKSTSTKADMLAENTWVLDLEDIEKDSGKLLTKKRKRNIEAKSDKHVFYKGNVLYSKLRPYLNKVIIADEDGVCTSEILAFDFGLISNRYAQIYLMSPYFVDYAMSDAYGVKMPRLGSKQGNNALMPIPSTHEQIRIISQIEALSPVIQVYGKVQRELDYLNTSINERLKKSILQEAIKGKLVSQIEEESTAIELLKQIKLEKLKLVKEGKLKKSALNDSIIFKGNDNKYYEQIGQKCVCIDEKIPFDIPTSWCWCRLSTVIDLLSGRDLEPTKYNSAGHGIPYMTGASNFNNGILIINRWTESPITVSHMGALLITCKGTIGEIAFNNIGDIHVARQIMSLSSTWVNLEYIKYFLMANISIIEKQANSMIPGISRDILLNALLPLPPLQEQNRIANCIRELSTLSITLCKLKTTGKIL